MRETKISKEELLPLIEEGLTTREIAVVLNINNSYVSYLAKKFGIEDKFKYAKPALVSDYFHKIDTKEKAYILGFLLADGCLDQNSISLSIALCDKCVVDFISSEIGFNVRVYDKYKPESRTFPCASISTEENNIIRDLKMLFGGEKKEDRRIPIIKKELEPYLVLGFFDGDGCITWGRRKDRDRVWQKVSFTSQLMLLSGIQSILSKNNITTKIYPKGNEKCFVMDICDKREVLKTLDFLYKDFIVLSRKYEKALALRRELGEFGEPLFGQYRAERTEYEGVETTGK